MGKITCEICGSEEIEKQGEKFICLNCGIRYSADNLRNMLKQTNTQNAESSQTKNEEENKDDKYIQEVEKAIADNDITKARQLIYLISDYDRAELLRCVLILASGSVNEPAFEDAINQINCTNHHGFEYLAIFTGEKKLLYLYLSLQYMMEYFIKLSKTLNPDIDMNKIRNDFPYREKNLHPYYELYSAFMDIADFCQRYNLVWEFCLAIKERKFLKTEEEVKNAIEKIKTDIAAGQTENYYDSFINSYESIYWYREEEKERNEEIVLQHDETVISFFNKMLEII